MANSVGGSTSNVRGVLSAVDLKLQMDALVSDLTHALDESQLSQCHRKRRGFKRRTKISNSIGIALCNRVVSEDSSSSIGDVVLSQDNKSSIPLSDSDDMSPPPDPRMQTPHLIHHPVPTNLVESDSVNENFSPSRPHNRKKQKCKRLALDPNAPSTSSNCHTGMERPSFHSSFRKKKSLRSLADNENKFIEISAGKRKRGRDRSMEWDHTRRYSSNRHRHATSSYQHIRIPPTQAAHIANEEYMDLEYSNESNTSGSSSESEAGIYTCDEGREADDEQSDWFAEPGAVYGVPGAESVSRNYNSDNRLVWWNEDNIGLTSSAKALFKEKYERMSQESQQSCRLRFQKLRERLLRREIRAGRRRLQERRPGFSIISSVNDKVSKFLQDPGQSELRLKPMTERDRDQLKHLANLYSLNVRPGDDHTAPILTKTRNTITTTQLDACGSFSEGTFPGGVPVPLSDLKRRRRTPPPNVLNMTEGSNDSIESVITNSNIGGCVSGVSSRPPVPTALWGDDDVGDCCADSLSERLADSEPEPIPSPTSLGLHDCTL